MTPASAREKLLRSSESVLRTWPGERAESCALCQATSQMVHLNSRRKLAVSATLLAVCSFAGGAYAATQDSDGSQQAFLNDVAKRLNVTPQKLTTALQGALDDQLNAAVKAGKLTQAQANALEQRVRQRGSIPFGFGLPGRGFGGPGGPGGGPGGPGFGPRGPGFGSAIRGSKQGVLGAAAKYMGLSVPQLVSQLEGGKSLAQVATAQGKSASGLASAIVSAMRTRLDQARAAGAITKTQEQKLLSHLQAGVQAMINGTGDRPRFIHPQALRPMPPGPGGSSGPPAPPAAF